MLHLKLVAILTLLSVVAKYTYASIVGSSCKKLVSRIKYDSLYHRLVNVIALNTLKRNSAPNYNQSIESY